MDEWRAGLLGSRSGSVGAASPCYAYLVVPKETDDGANRCAWACGFHLFRAIVEQAPDAIIFADRDGLIRIWNHGAETIFGYSAAEVLAAASMSSLQSDSEVPIGKVFTGPSTAA